MMVTWAGVSPVLSKHAVSWLSMAGSGPLLVGGIQPSAMAQRFRPSEATITP